MITDTQPNIMQILGTLTTRKKTKQKNVVHESRNCEWRQLNTNFKPIFCCFFLWNQQKAVHKYITCERRKDV